MVKAIFEKKENNFSPWLGMGAFALVYLLLFMFNYILPVNNANYSMRLWGWIEGALSITAAVVWARNRDAVNLRIVTTGLILTLFCVLPKIAQGQNYWENILSSGSVFFCFLGGALIFQSSEMSKKVAAFQAPGKVIIKNLLIGVGLALPLAVLNNLYFYLTSGSFEIQNVFLSALEALRPAVAEEVVFRYFILALCFSFFGQKKPGRWQMAAALFLAVVPHSLNHLPDLFLQNPLMGAVMLLMTSLLFGLPMALLQVKRDLGSAIAFHWLIDFVRFLFGY